MISSFLNNWDLKKCFEIFLWWLVISIIYHNSFFSYRSTFHCLSSRVRCEACSLLASEVPWDLLELVEEGGGEVRRACSSKQPWLVQVQSVKWSLWGTIQKCPKQRSPWIDKLIQGPGMAGRRAGEHILAEPHGLWKVKNLHFLTKFLSPIHWVFNHLTAVSPGGLGGQQWTYVRLSREIETISSYCNCIVRRGGNISS